MALTEIEPMMADVVPASLDNAGILDEIMNDGDEEAMRQLEIDIHEEVCTMMFLHSCFVVAKFLHKVAKAPTQPREYLKPRARLYASRNGTRTGVHHRNTATANNTEPPIYPDYYKGPVSSHFDTMSICRAKADTVIPGTN